MLRALLPTSLVDVDTEDLFKKIVQIKRQELKVSTLLGYDGGIMHNETEPPEDSTRKSLEGY